jgi:signal transduction histidine kinase
MSFWQTLTGRLFRLVFGWYLALAIVVTAVQLGLEYSAINEDIAANLHSLGRSFAPSVADALWAIDRPQLDALATGMVRATYVTGVRIEDDHGHAISRAGVLPGPVNEAARGFFAPYLVDDMALTIRTLRGEDRVVGRLALYSGRAVAVDRIKYSFFVILTNSLIKTAGLWLIFYLVITRVLARPLAALTQTVSRIEAAAEPEGTPSSGDDRDELARLLLAMDKMQERIVAAQQLLAERNAELAQALDLAESANRLKSTFLANVSHELRTPLNQVLGYAQILVLDEDLDAGHRQCATEIEASGRQLLNLINDIIDVSRVEAGAAVRTTTTYDLHELLAFSVKIVNDVAADCGTSVSLQRADNVPRLVTGDGRMLRQAVLNLLSAVAKRNKGGSVVLVAERGDAAAGARLRLSVDLPATALPAGDLDRLFEPFAVSRMGDAQAHGGQGTGLELVLAWDYAHLLDGTMTAVRCGTDGARIALEVPISVADWPTG